MPVFKEKSTRGSDPEEHCQKLVIADFATTSVGKKTCSEMTVMNKTCHRDDTSGLPMFYTRPTLKYSWEFSYLFTLRLCFAHPWVEPSLNLSPVFCGWLFLYKVLLRGWYNAVAPSSRRSAACSSMYLGCRSVVLLVHMLSFVLAMWPAHFHSVFMKCFMTSLTFVLPLVMSCGILNHYLDVEHLSGSLY